MTPKQLSKNALLSRGYPLVQQFLPLAENEAHAEHLRHNHLFEKAYPEHEGSFSVTETDGERIHCNLCNCDAKLSCASQMAQAQHLLTCIYVCMDPVICLRCEVNNWWDLSRGIVDDPCHFSRCMTEEEFGLRIEWIMEVAELVRHL